MNAVIDCVLALVALAATCAGFLVAAVLIDRWAGHHETALEAEDEK